MSVASQPVRRRFVAGRAGNAAFSWGVATVQEGCKRSVGRTRVGSLVVLAFISFLWAGCTPSSPPEGGLVRVSGRVTLDGGAWPIPGQITFVPRGAQADSGKGPARSAVTTFATNGDFEVVGGYGEGKGLRPGEYWVAVDCPEGDPEMVDPTKKAASSKNYAPERYRSPETSGFNVRVGDEPVEAKFDVKTK